MTNNFVTEKKFIFIVYVRFDCCLDGKIAILYISFSFTRERTNFLRRIFVHKIVKDQQNADRLWDVDFEK